MARWRSKVLSLLMATPVMGALSGCREERPPLLAEARLEHLLAVELDAELLACEARRTEVLSRPAVAGAPTLEDQRLALLGRARGEPVIWTRAPKPTPDADLGSFALASRQRFEHERPGGRVVGLRDRHRADPRTLRSLLLREGYFIADHPEDAFQLTQQVTLTDLFDEQRIVLERGSDQATLERTVAGRSTKYVYSDGPRRGRAAEVLFGDRLGLAPAELHGPLHRDVLGLAEEVGFDRISIEHHTERELDVRLRFGEQWVRAVVSAEGPRMSLECIAEPPSARAAVARFVAETAWRRRALRRMRDVVQEQLDEALTFDRPRGEETADRDGQLRPAWLGAYLAGRSAYTVDDEVYLVHGADGRPTPPQVCVDFVLDTFERGSGNWFRPRGDRPGRTPGSLDFDSFGIENRRAVLAFGEFASGTPSLFSFSLVEDSDRIPFARREQFFDALPRHDLQPGDIVAIRGLKRDDRVHQHAILIESVDPLTGFPHLLADQMKKPRRRTWEAIMAEAPKRSLYYKVRPTRAVLEQLDPER